MFKPFRLLRSPRMENVPPLLLGLTLRYLLDLIAPENAAVCPLIGIWEGVILNHYLHIHKRWRWDPCIAFGFRLLVDFFFTQSLSRLGIVAIWAGLAYILSDIVPSIWKDARGARRVWRRLKAELSYWRMPQIPFLSAKSSKVRFQQSRSSSVASGRTRTSASTGITRFTTYTRVTSPLSQAVPLTPLFSPTLRSESPSRTESDMLLPKREHVRYPPKRPVPGQFPDDWSETESVVSEAASDITVSPLPPLPESIQGGSELGPEDEEEPRDLGYGLQLHVDEEEQPHPEDVPVDSAMSSFELVSPAVEHAPEPEPEAPPLPAPPPRDPKGRIITELSPGGMPEWLVQSPAHIWADPAPQDAIRTHDEIEYHWRTPGPGVERTPTQGAAPLPVPGPTEAHDLFSSDGPPPAPPAKSKSKKRQSTSGGGVPFPKGMDDSDDEETVMHSNWASSGDVPSTPTVLTASPEELLKEAAELRAAAEAAQKASDGFEDQRKDAVHGRRPSLVVKTKVDRDRKAEEARRLHKRAERRVFAAHNPEGLSPVDGMAEIKVYGLHPDEGVRRTEAKFAQVMQSGGTSLKVVVKQPTLPGQKEDGDEELTAPNGDISNLIDDPVEVLTPAKPIIDSTPTPPAGDSKTAGRNKKLKDKSSKTATGGVPTRANSPAPGAAAPGAAAPAASAKGGPRAGSPAPGAAAPGKNISTKRSSLGPVGAGGSTVSGPDGASAPPRNGGLSGKTFPLKTRIASAMRELSVTVNDDPYDSGVLILTASNAA